MTENRIEAAVAAEDDPAVEHTSRELERPPAHEREARKCLCRAKADQPGDNVVG